MPGVLGSFSDTLPQTRCQWARSRQEAAVRRGLGMGRGRIEKMMGRWGGRAGSRAHLAAAASGLRPSLGKTRCHWAMCGPPPPPHGNQFPALLITQLLPPLPSRDPSLAQVSSPGWASTPGKALAPILFPLPNPGEMERKEVRFHQGAGGEGGQMEGPTTGTGGLGRAHLASEVSHPLRFLRKRPGPGKGAWHALDSPN